MVRVGQQETIKHDAFQDHLDYLFVFDRVFQSRKETVIIALISGDNEEAGFKEVIVPKSRTICAS